MSHEWGTAAVELGLARQTEVQPRILNRFVRIFFLIL